MSDKNYNILSGKMEEFLDRLKELDLIKVSKIIDENDVCDLLNKDILIKLMVKPQLLTVEDDNLIVTVDGEKYKISIGTNIVKGRNKLSLVLPDITFDVDQDGNVARQVEAESIYKCTVVSSIFDDLYKEEIDEILSTYDFDSMSNASENYPFSRLRSEIEEEASYVMKMVLSACTIKLSNYASKNTSKILSLLTVEERSQVEALVISTKSILFKAQVEIDAEQDPLERKVKIYAKDKLINETIENSEIGKVFRIINLSSEAIPTKARIKISREAKKFSNEVVLQKDNLNEGEHKILKQYLFSRFRRRGWKQFVAELKETEYIKYSKDPKGYQPVTKR